MDSHRQSEKERLGGEVRLGSRLCKTQKKIGQGNIDSLEGVVLHDRGTRE